MLATYEAESTKSAAKARLAPGGELAKARRAVHAAKHAIRKVLREVEHANPGNRQWIALMPAVERRGLPGQPAQGQQPLPPQKASQPAAKNGMGLVGRRVEKRFGALGLFGGVVSGYARGLYAVAYDDGDGEELSLAELGAVLVPVPEELPPVENTTSGSEAGAKAGNKADADKEDDDGGVRSDDGSVDVEEVGCSVCGALESTEENDILLCDRAGCYRAYHMW